VSISPFSIANRDDDFMILKFDDLFTLKFAKFRGQKNRLPKFHCTLRSRLTRSHRLSHNLSTDPGFADSFISFVFCQWLSCYPQVGKIYKDVFFNAWWEKSDCDESPMKHQVSPNNLRMPGMLDRIASMSWAPDATDSYHMPAMQECIHIWLLYDFHMTLFDFDSYDLIANYWKSFWWHVLGQGWMV
jgi:hypothetical protein